MHLNDPRLHKRLPAAISMVTQGINLLKEIHTLDKNTVIDSYVLGAIRINDFKTELFPIGTVSRETMRHAEQSFKKDVLIHAQSNQMFINKMTRCEGYLFGMQLPELKGVTNTKFLQLITAAVAASWLTCEGDLHAVVAIKEEADAISIQTTWDHICTICMRAHTPNPVILLERALSS